MKYFFLFSNNIIENILDSIPISIYLSNIFYLILLMRMMNMGEITRMMKMMRMRMKKKNDENEYEDNDYFEDNK